MNIRSLSFLVLLSLVSSRWQQVDLETIQLQTMQIGRGGAGPLRQAWLVVMLRRLGVTQRT